MDDHKTPKLPKNQREWIYQLDKVMAEHDKKLLAYFDERMLNLVAQFRGLAIALNVSPEIFWKAFTDDKAGVDPRRTWEKRRGDSERQK